MHRSSLLLRILIFSFLFFIKVTGNAQYFTDQFFEIYGPHNLINAAEDIDNIIIDHNEHYLVLTDGETEGSLTFQPITLEQSFNRGLPSWNAMTLSSTSSIKVEMRFLVNDNWSGWTTVGYWRDMIWNTYGATSFNGGYIDVDYVKMDNYINTFQYRINFKRISITDDSPRLKQIAFSSSDTEYPIDITAITTDNPDALFISTNHIYQYAVDDDIGGRICSPATTTMILKSYDKDVDAYDFALRTYDSYWDMFGVWPRSVSSASEYGVKGAVTRYRTWSEAATVLQNGGRIAISVGPPLYTGHLMMLAGFDVSGNPIVHDPARSNGYAYVYNKYDISASWFNKGGIAYTFYNDTVATDISTLSTNNNMLKVYPNPAKDNIYFKLYVSEKQNISFKIFDIRGRCTIEKIIDVHQGKNTIHISTKSIKLNPGMYIVQFSGKNFNTSKRIIIQ